MEIFSCIEVRNLKINTAVLFYLFIVSQKLMLINQIVLLLIEQCELRFYNPDGWTEWALSKGKGLEYASRIKLLVEDGDSPKDNKWEEDKALP